MQEENDYILFDGVFSIKKELGNGNHLARHGHGIYLGGSSHPVVRIDLDKSNVWNMMPGEYI